VKVAWQGTGVALPDTVLEPMQIVGQTVEVRVPFNSAIHAAGNTRHPSSPGVQGHLRFRVSGWNSDR
jgi:hypothetical protein